MDTRLIVIVAVVIVICAGILMFVHPTPKNQATGIAISWTVADAKNPNSDWYGDDLNCLQNLPHGRLAELCRITCMVPPTGNIRFMDVSDKACGINNIAACSSYQLLTTNTGKSVICSQPGCVLELDYSGSTVRTYCMT